MENELINAQEPEELKPSTDTLLVLNIHTNQVEMVKGVDKEGNLQKVTPQEKKENEPLIRVDKHGDLFSNFFFNFYRQLKNPTHFNFFKVSEYDAVNTLRISKNMLIRHPPRRKRKAERL